MIKITYIVSFLGMQKNINSVMHAINNINTKYIHDYILIIPKNEDGKLNNIDIQIQDFLNQNRSTVISGFDHDRSILINQAVKIANGDFVQIICNNLPMKNSTDILVDACIKHNSDIAIGNHKFLNENIVAIQKIKSNTKTANTTIMNLIKPVNNIILGEPACIRNIGDAGSIVSKDFINSIVALDERIYEHNPLFSLVCGMNSNITYLNQYTSYNVMKKHVKKDTTYDDYNLLQSILFFMEDNMEESKKHIHELKKILVNTIYNRNYFAKMTNIFSKYFKKDIPVQSLIESYKDAIKKYYKI